MNRSNLNSSRNGVTLIEMLVVIGIIVLLAALLTPAAYGALVRARNFAMGAEINKLQQAIEAYKLENGDYPPSFGDGTVSPLVRGILERHIAKCYPKINPTHRTQFLDAVQPTTGTPTWNIDQSEALVFWLSRTVRNPVLPFPGLASSDTNAAQRVYFDFDVRRLESAEATPDAFQSFHPQYARNTYYVYIDSRTYNYHMNNPAGTAGSPKLAARSEGPLGVVRPYFSDTVDTDTTNPFGYKFMNPTTYQILCAGQDGEWHLYPANIETAATAPKKNIIRWPSGTEADNTPVYGNTAYPNSEANFDNLANFSEGRTFKAAMPTP